MAEGTEEPLPTQISWRVLEPLAKALGIEVTDIAGLQYDVERQVLTVTRQRRTPIGTFQSDAVRQRTIEAFEVVVG